MTDSLIALVPNYGVWLICLCVLLSGIAIPIPSSVLVMIAGGFAAVGDLALDRLIFFTCLGSVLGDQIGYFTFFKYGDRLEKIIYKYQKPTLAMNKAQALIGRNCSLALILGHTILSPLGPYFAFLTGFMRWPWLRFTIPATLGALIWSIGYVFLGYIFADQISTLAKLISESILLMAFVIIIFGLLWWVYLTWRKNQGQE